MLIAVNKGLVDLDAVWHLHRYGDGAVRISTEHDTLVLNESEDALLVETFFSAGAISADLIIRLGEALHNLRKREYVGDMAKCE